MRAAGSACRAFSRRAGQMSATAVMRSGAFSGPKAAYAGTWPFSEMKPYPTTAPRITRSLIVLVPDVVDDFLAHHPPHGVLELRLLHEEIVLGVEVRRRHRALEVEAQPLLRAVEAGALREVEQEREV